MSQHIPCANPRQNILHVVCLPPLVEQRLNPDATLLRAGQLLDAYLFGRKLQQEQAVAAVQESPAQRGGSLPGLQGYRERAPRGG